MDSSLLNASRWFARSLGYVALLLGLFTSSPIVSGQAVAPTSPDPTTRFPLLGLLASADAPLIVAYSPSQLDPRVEANQRKLTTSSLRADLEALRPTFEGLALYGYNESVTPRLLGIAKELKFRMVLLGIWEPKSADEVDGVIELARLHRNDFALGVLVGNEGLSFNRYEVDDLKIAAARLRARLPATIPLGTTETWAGSKRKVVQEFGDFLAVNIHPVFDRPKLGPAAAAAWAREQALAIAQLARKPVLLKETGFPHDGKEGYTPVTQQTFWSAYLAAPRLVRPPSEPNAWVFHGFAFEAFDLPWKSQATGKPIERSWGLFTNDRQPLSALEPWKAAAQARAGQTYQPAPPR